MGIDSTDTVKSANPPPRTSSTDPPKLVKEFNQAVSTVAGNGSPPDDLPDAGKLGFSQLVEDIDKTNEWISRQTTSSPEMNRMTERLQELQKELAKRQDGMRKAASAPKGKATSKSPAQEPASSSDAMPRMLRERTSIQYATPDEARAEVDRIAAWLQRSDVSRADRRLLQTELDNLAPQFEQGRQQHAQERRTQVITQALAPSSGLADAKAQVLDSLARIDGIVALPDRPGFFALMRGSEQIVLTGDEVAQLRTSAEKSLDTAAKRARGLNETTFGRLNDHMKLNYEEHPYVGFAVSVVSGEEPVEVYDRVQPMVATSNSTLTRYRQQAEAGAPLAKRAAILLEGVEGAERARVTLDKGVDRAMSAAGDIVTGLTVTRDLSFAISLSLGAVVAAPVVAAGVGAGGLGLTGAGAVAATGVGTGAVVGTGGFALRGGSAVAGELAAGHSLEQAASVGWQEGKRGAKEGFVSGVGGGVGLSTGRALGLGAQQLSRAQTITRSVAAGSAGGGSSELARGIIERRGVVDTLKGTGKGLVLGGGGGLIGGASSTISNPVLRQTAAIGGDVALNAGVAYAETGSLREAALAGASSIAVSGSVAAARQHPPGTGTGERWAADVGKSVRRQTGNVVASAMLGMANVPAFRGTGAAAGTVISQPLPGDRLITETPTRPVTSTHEAPVKAADVAQAGSDAAASRGQTATQTTQPTIPAGQPAASQATQPLSTARVAGPEVFAEISAELGPLGGPVITDPRTPLARAANPMTRSQARAYANQQAADFRAATNMNEGATVQAGHTAAARHASESGISRADWDTQPMQQLHSRKGQGLDVTVTDQAGNVATRTRHTSQEGLINDAVARVRAANGGVLTPQGQLDAANEVAWRTANVPMDQRDINGIRNSAPRNAATAAPSNEELPASPPAR